MLRDGAICCDCPASELSEQALDSFYAEELSAPEASADVGPQGMIPSC